MGDQLVVYITTVSSNFEIKKKQQRIKNILDGKKVSYTEIDIAQNADDKNKMRELMGDETALPPQIFVGESHLGDYDAFDAAVEEERLDEFLKL